MVNIEDIVGNNGEYGSLAIKIERDIQKNDSKIKAKKFIKKLIDAEVEIASKNARKTYDSAKVQNHPQAAKKAEEIITHYKKINQHPRLVAESHQYLLKEMIRSGKHPEELGITYEGSWYEYSDEKTLAEILKAACLRATLTDQFDESFRMSKRAQTTLDNTADADLLAYCLLYQVEFSESLAPETEDTHKRFMECNGDSGLGDDLFKYLALKKYYALKGDLENELEVLKEATDRFKTETHLVHEYVEKVLSREFFEKVVDIVSHTNEDAARETLRSNKLCSKFIDATDKLLAMPHSKNPKYLKNMADWCLRYATEVEDLTHAQKYYNKINTTIPDGLFLNDALLKAETIENYFSNSSDYSKINGIMLAYNNFCGNLEKNHSYCYASKLRFKLSEWHAKHKTKTENELLDCAVIIRATHKELDSEEPIKELIDGLKAKVRYFKKRDTELANINSALQGVILTEKDRVIQIIAEVYKPRIKNGN